MKRLNEDFEYMFILFDSFLRSYKYVRIVQRILLHKQIKRTIIQFKAWHKMNIWEPIDSYA